ncbi:Sec-independent protein translocase protein TatB [Sinorhizobium sp. BG8]|uniref:Sec-independent protein translocase protein TatB n=1 Tax=Sinorhizobium sp. BG8 TaxID=2613773 RepID=UPI00193DC8CE|nr:Sec-independent protein translocase protein TatB [Sinorhizobium sp. BG8]QRM55367.1 twin-arginine translocase subunit TatB [Sinorhizobium sp. BG8]
MLEVGWSEILVIAIVLIIVVGPKDLPPMLRAFGRMTTKMRGMASDFRSQFDEALREADLDDVRKTIGDAQKLNPMNTIRDAVNPLKQMGSEIQSDLRKAASTTPATTPSVPEAASAEAAGDAAAATVAVAATEPQPAASMASAPQALVSTPVVAAAVPSSAPAVDTTLVAAEPLKGGKAAKVKAKSAAPAKSVPANETADLPKSTKTPARGTKTKVEKTAAVEKPAPRKTTTRKKKKDEA